MFEELNDYMHFQFMQQAVKDKKNTRKCTLLCKDPGLKYFICIKKGKRVLYIQLIKALFRCVQLALLWYKLFSTTSVDMGFELNPYNLCVANALTNGKQCTIMWSVDFNIK